ncbi:hypothetical protein ONZ43_g6218 [Nemania bipapillata]|uniref:Uncharacterized protein n=1 Tax=Nemania bipapillata TaxID=110536 RepID=A0ACC2I2D3_9PEZI|nr:hypothetical protein ONZ43_g6218 [Nemania bipapillata]
MPTKKTPPPNESVTYSSGSEKQEAPELRILHYNDVYHVDASSSEPVGGAARFMSLVQKYRDGDEFKGQSELLTFFSGDAFNPSLESSVTKGTDAAALGNHDLDFGVLKFRHLASKCSFPSSLGRRRAHRELQKDSYDNIIKCLPPNLVYKSASETAKELVPQLRAEGAEIVIAITHQREPNDNKLAEQTDGIIDIILGGHDHYYNHSLIKGTHVLRSGTDFKQLSYIEARRKPDGSGKWDIDIIRRDITSEIPEHKSTSQLVEKLTASLKTALQKPIGYTAAPLDARFRTVRMEESNIANFVCDIMRHHYSGDCSIMASGTVRGDQIYPPGPILLKDIMTCFPFEDPVVVIRVLGQAIWDALENGLSQYPALEGRFPQVSNIKFEFDARKPSGSRITSASIGGDPIDMAKKYVLVTRGYMARGKDGYDSLLVESEGGTAEEIVSEENGILISMMLRQYFMSLKVVGQWKHLGASMSRHWAEVTSKVCTSHPHYTACPPSPVRKSNPRQTSGWDHWKPAKIRERRASVTHPIDESDSDSEGESENAIEKLDHEMQTMRRVFSKWARIAGVNCKVADELKADEFEVDWTRAIAPRVEGRIIRLDADQ